MKDQLKHRHKCHLHDAYIHAVELQRKLQRNAEAKLIKELRHDRTNSDNSSGRTNSSSFGS